MNKQQLEIGFEQSVAFRPGPRRQRRLARARWWFAQMRQADDQTWEWAPPQPPPAQPPALAFPHPPGRT